jgi:hypothetical protein
VPADTRIYINIAKSSWCTSPASLLQQSSFFDLLSSQAILRALHHLFICLNKEYPDFFSWLIIMLPNLEVKIIRQILQEESYS